MPIFYLHGLGQTPSAWAKTLAHLPQTHKPVCPDLASFHTLSNESASYDTMYRAFCRSCEAFDEPFALCGLSLGAVLALNYAVDHPQRVSAMVLAAPQYDMPKNLLKIQNILFKFMPDRAFAGMGLTKQDFISLTNSMTGLDFTARLDRVICPVTVVCGERDGANRKASVKLTELLPNAEFISVPGAGHEINVDAPEKLAEIIEKRLYKSSLSCEQ